MLALVYWTDFNSTSIVDVSAIPECSRQVGKIDEVLWTDSKKYTAQIIRIAKNPETLEKADKEFLLQLNKTAMGSRNPQKAVPSLASNQDKSKLSVSQKKEEKQAKVLGKARASNSRSRERENLALLTLSRGSFFGEISEPKHSSQSKSLVSANPTVFKSKEPKSINPIKRQLFGSDKIDEKIQDDLEEEKEDNVPDTSDSSDDEVVLDKCRRCSAIVKTLCPQVRRFFEYLCNFAEGKEERCENPNDKTEVQYLQPLPISPSVKQVEINRGCGLFISKPAKAKIAVESANDPFKLSRKLLSELFGCQLKQAGTSAMGKGKQHLGIEETHLLGMYEFVSRNANIKNPPGVIKGRKSKPQFTFAAFIRELNRKMRSARRHRKNTLTKSSPIKTGKPGKKSTASSPAKPSGHEEGLPPLRSSTNMRWHVSQTPPKSPPDHPVVVKADHPPINTSQPLIPVQHHSLMHPPGLALPHPHASQFPYPNINPGISSFQFSRPNQHFQPLQIGQPQASQHQPTHLSQYSPPPPPNSYQAQHEYGGWCSYPGQQWGDRPHYEFPERTKEDDSKTLVSL